MSKKRWKITERKHAELLEAKRLYNIGQDTPDSISDHLAIESKSLGDSKFPKTMEVFMQQSESNAASILDREPNYKSRIPIVILHKASNLYLNDIVLIRLEEFITMCSKLGWLRDENKNI